MTNSCIYTALTCANLFLLERSCLGCCSLHPSCFLGKHGKRDECVFFSGSRCNYYGTKNSTRSVRISLSIGGGVHEQSVVREALTESIAGSLLFMFILLGIIFSHCFRSPTSAYVTPRVFDHFARFLSAPQPSSKHYTVLKQLSCTK